MRVLAINIAPIPINTFCNFACLYFPLYVLGAARSNLQPDIKPTKRPFEMAIMAVPINSVRMLISNSLFPLRILRKLPYVSSK